MVRLTEIALPAAGRKHFRQACGSVEDFADVEFAAVIEAAEESRGFRSGQSVILGGGGGFAERIDEKDPSARSEAGANHLPKGIESFRRNMREPKAEKYGIEH